MSKSSNKTTTKKKQKQHKPDRTYTPEERRKRFIAKYIETQNITESAKYAGYSEKTAAQQGSRLLKKVQVKSEIEEGLKAIRAAHDKELKNTIATAQEVMEYFTRVMNGEEKDQFGLDASLSERTRAAQELARRTIDLENRIAGKGNPNDMELKITLDWGRDN